MYILYPVEKLKNVKTAVVFQNIVIVALKPIPSYTPGAGFMNRRRLCQLTAAILTSDLTTHMWVL